MDERHEQFLQMAKERFLDDFEAKFRKGNEDNKGDFFAIDGLMEALKENYDQFSYIVKEILERKEREEKIWNEGYAKGFKDALLAVPDKEDMD